MGRTISVWLLVCGMALVALGIWISLPVQSAVAQDSLSEATYIGSKECQGCHRGLAREHANTPHALALQDVKRSKKDILGDFDQGAEVRMMQFPGEDAPRPFTADDIAYAIGAGRYFQRYLYEVERRVYAVLPAEWDTVNQAWRAYRPSEAWPGPEHDWVQNCAGCHTTGLEVENSRWEDDGVQCEACHGPGSVHADLADDAGRRPNDDELLQIHGAIVVSPDGQICGQCHSQGLSDSAHPYPVGYRPGTELAGSGGFQLLAEDDPAAWYASGHGRLNNMQFNEWLTSAHATSLDTLVASSSAQDGCLACHSGDVSFTERILAQYDSGDLSGPPPEAPTLANARFSITCTTCHSPHHAAEDVEFQLVSAADVLCGTCHRNTDLMPPIHHPAKEMFEGEALVEGIEGIPSAHFSAQDGPRCVTCHMQGVSIDGATLANHTWKPVIPGGEDSPPSACSTCHTDLVTGDLQSLIEDTQAAVRSRLSVARARLGSVTLPEEGTAERGTYDRVVTALNFVQNDGSLGVHNYAYADALLDETSKLLAQLSVPGASLQPTEGPAPTATPAGAAPITVGMELPSRTGLRPMTIILISATLLVLLVGTLFILRQSRRGTRRRETNP